MKYQAYPEYKDSGVEWIGVVPSHWKLTRIKFITQCLDGARIPLNAQERGEIQGDIPYWGANKVVGHVNDFLFDEELVLVGEDGAPFFDMMKDVAFNVAGKIWPNNHVHVLRPCKKSIDLRFLKYALNCADYHLYISGSTRDKLNQSDMNEIYVRRCELHEQQQIANFLDHETAKIDTLIEKQQQLIKLLKEKRQAVISHAVTKGLNPNAPMRDSGVEWLGEVPEHWVTKVKLSGISESNRGSFVNGPFGSDLLANELRGEGVPVIYIRDIKRTGYKRKSAVCVTKEKAKQLEVCKVQSGNILISKVGDPPGDACVYPENEPDAIITQDVIRIRVDRTIANPLFLAMLLNSDFGQMVINDISVEGTRKRVSLGDFKATRFILPSLNEQNDIVAYIDGQCAKMNVLVAKSLSAVDLIRERRTALISAAVTGKIDVRGN